MNVKFISIISSIVIHGAGVGAAMLISGNSNTTSQGRVYEVSLESLPFGNESSTSKFQSEITPSTLIAPVLLKKEAPKNIEEISLNKKMLPKVKSAKSIEKRENFSTNLSSGSEISSPSGGRSGLGSGTFGNSTSAQIISAPRPSYPPRARKLGIEGAVVLVAKVSPSGEVSDTLIEKSSGRSDLDESAKETVKNLWRFIPAKNQGISVASSERVIVMFKLTA